MDEMSPHPDPLPAWAGRGNQFTRTDNMTRILKITRLLPLLPKGGEGRGKGQRMFYFFFDLSQF